MSQYVRKTSGEKEPFDIKKIEHSLKKAGANEDLVHATLREIKAQNPQTTEQVHAIASGFLQKITPPIAARYNLKRALMQLGPIGFPFEQFVAHILQAQGFNTKTNETIQGRCIKHEIDVRAQKDNQQFIIECKFHNQLGTKSSIQDALYTQARFEDIKQGWQHNPEQLQAWLITNTQFTSEVIQYAECVHMQLLGWNYPTNTGLAYLIDTLGLHPITALQDLTTKQKHNLIKQGLVLCRDAKQHVELFKKIGFSDHKIKKIIEQAQAVCRL